MGSFGIPNPFQVPPPQGVSPQGSVVGANPTAMNRQPGAAQAINGINQLLQGFVGAREATKAHFAQKYQNAVQQIADGTNPNPDYNEIMGWAKKSGMPVNLKTNPAEATAHVQAQQAAQTQPDPLAYQTQAYANGQPVQSPGGAGSVAGGGMPPQGQAPGSSQGLLSRMGQSLGLSAGPITPGNPLEQQLRALKEVGMSSGGAAGMAGMQKQGSLLAMQVQKAANQLGIAHSEAMLPLYTQTVKKALGGDPEAAQMLERFGIGKANPLDDYKVIMKAVNPEMSDSDVTEQAGTLGLQLQLGIPQFKMKMYELAAAPERLAMFGNDFAKSFANLQDPTNGPKAGFTPLQQSQLSEADKNTATKAEASAAAHSKYYSELADQYPDAPPQLIEAYASAKLSGQDDTAKAISKFIGGDVTSGQPARYKTKNQWENTRFDQRLGFDWQSFQGNLGVRQGELDQSKLHTVLDALRDTNQPDIHIMEHQSDYSGDQVRGAWQNLQEAATKRSDLKVNIGGKEVPISNAKDLLLNYNWAGTGWAYGRPSSGPTKTPDSTLSKYYSHTAPTTNKVDPYAIMKQLQSLPPEEQKALGATNWMVQQ